MSDLISRQAAIDHWRLIIDATSMDSRYDMGFVDGLEFCINHLSTMPAAQPEPEWNNHTVACLLAELFGDTCACNFNGIDEWLPEKCEVIDA